MLLYVKTLRLENFSLPRWMGEKESTQKFAMPINSSEMEDDAEWLRRFTHKADAFLCVSPSKRLFLYIVSLRSFLVSFLRNPDAAVMNAFGCAQTEIIRILIHPETQYNQHLVFKVVYIIFWYNLMIFQIIFISRLRRDYFVKCTSDSTKTEPSCFYFQLIISWSNQVRVNSLKIAQRL